MDVHYGQSNQPVNRRKLLTTLWRVLGQSWVYFSSNYSGFLKRHLHLRNRILDQGYKKIRLIRSLKKFIFFTSHIDKTIFLTFLLTPYLYTLSLYEHPSFIIFSAETEYITGYWTRAIKRFALFDLLKSLYSDTKILSKYIPTLQR
jgi:hypothetical protein